MNDRIKMRFWQSCFFLVVLLSALMATGCNTMSGLGQDMSRGGVWLTNAANYLQDQDDHGQHTEHYRANLKGWWTK